MKKWLVVLLVLLMGCQTAPPITGGHSFCAQGYTLIDGGCIKDVASAPVEEPVLNETVEPVAEPQQEEPITEHNEEFATGFVNTTTTNPVSLLPELFEKIDSYGYTFERNEYAVVDNNVRVFYNTILNLGDFRVNSIYFDTLQRTAVGKCIPDRYFVKRGLHTQCDELGDKEYELAFADYYEKTPGEYLREFLNKEPEDIIENQRVGNRDAYLFIFRQGEAYQNFWADAIYGMPLRIEWHDGEDTLAVVEFKDVILNDYTLDDVTP